MCYHYVSINNIKNQAFFQTILFVKTYRMNQCQTQLEKSWKFKFAKKGDKANLTNSALVNFAKTVCDFLIFYNRTLPRQGCGFKGCGENPNSPQVILPSSTKCDIREAKRTATGWRSTAI